MRSHEILTQLLNTHLQNIRDYPLSEIKALDPDLHYEIIDAQIQVDKAYFREDISALLKAMKAVQELYLRAAEKHFKRVK